jgi:hypothetical protein
MKISAVCIVAFNGAIVVYLFIGIIATTIKNQVVGFPNADFWREFWMSFVFVWLAVSGQRFGKHEAHSQSLQNFG